MVVAGTWWIFGPKAAQNTKAVGVPWWEHIGVLTVGRGRGMCFQTKASWVEEVFGSERWV